MDEQRLRITLEDNLRTTNCQKPDIVQSFISSIVVCSLAYLHVCT